MLNLIAVDPGSTESAVVRYEISDNWKLGSIVEFFKDDNFLVLERLKGMHDTAGVLAIEMIASYGKPVGAEVFVTCVWIGRYLEAMRGMERMLIERPDVKLLLCHSRNQVTDAILWQELLNRFGPGKAKAVGTKKKPGPLYGLHSDVRAALALAEAVRTGMQENNMSLFTKHIAEVIDEPIDSYMSRV